MQGPRLRPASACSCRRKRKPGFDDSCEPRERGVVIVDATVWIDSVHGSETQQTVWLDRELDRQRLVIFDDCVAKAIPRERHTRKKNG